MKNRPGGAGGMNIQKINDSLKSQAIHHIAKCAADNKRNRKKLDLAMCTKQPDDKNHNNNKRQQAQKNRAIIAWFVEHPKTDPFIPNHNDIEKRNFLPKNDIQVEQVSCSYM